MAVWPIQWELRASVHRRCRRRYRGLRADWEDQYMARKDDWDRKFMLHITVNRAYRRWMMRSWDKDEY